jgi:predicted Fe-S protein YdhL (DUF1289 family)
MSSTPADPPSPCIGVCQINPLTDYCDGCFRDMDEISNWWGLSPEAKLRVLAELEERRERVFASLWD